MLYRIYTENKDYDLVVKKATEKFPGGFTVFKGVGVWKGGVELALVIEIIEMDAEEEKWTGVGVMALAEEIRVMNGQETVLVVSMPIVGHLVRGKK